MDRTDHDYRQVLSSLKLATLEDRIHIADAMFLYKIIYGFISSPYLLSLVKFNAASEGLRSRPIFVASLPKYRYFACDPINRTISIMNQHFSSIDPFLCSLNSFRTLLHRIKYNQNGET